MQSPNSQVWYLVIPLLGLVALAGCGGGGSSSTTPPPSGIVVTVSPKTDTIGVGANLQYTATVTGTSNQTVQWSVSGQGAGTIDANTGLYIAPQTVPSPATVTITATSLADTTQRGTATTMVQA